MKLSWTLNFGIVVCLVIFFRMVQDISPGEKNFFVKGRLPETNLRMQMLYLFKRERAKDKIQFSTGSKPVEKDWSTSEENLWKDDIQSEVSTAVWFLVTRFCLVICWVLSLYLPRLESIHQLL